MSPAPRLCNKWPQKTNTFYFSRVVDCVGFCHTVCNLHESQLSRISTRLIKRFHRVSLNRYIYMYIKEVTKMYNYLDSGNYSANSAVCGMLLPYLPNFPLYELSTIIFFLIPMLVILVVYTRMGLKIRNSTNHTLNSVMQGAIHGDSRQTQSRKSVIRMLSKTSFIFNFLHNTFIFVRFVTYNRCFSCCGYFIFHLLGTVSCSTIALYLRARI